MSQRTIIVGTGSFARELVAAMQAASRGAYALIGLVSEKRISDAGLRDAACPVLGPMTELHRIIARYNPRRIVVAVERLGDQLPEQLVAALVHRGVVVESGSIVYERLTGKVPIEVIGPADLLFNEWPRPSGAIVSVARGASLAAAILGIVVCLPLAIVIALAIKLTSPGPVFFTQERVGWRGERFRLVKFRSMTAVNVAKSEWARDNMERITAVGAWIRKYRLDEIPQFINVLRGHMNLVGPRPHPVSNSEIVSLIARNATDSGNEMPYYALRTSVRPGITGWAQVRYQYANGFNEELEKLKYDLYYVKNYSLLMDIRILFETVSIVIKGHVSATSPDTRTSNVRHRNPTQHARTEEGANGSSPASVITKGVTVVYDRKVVDGTEDSHVATETAGRTAKVTTPSRSASPSDRVPERVTNEYGNAN